ncbi:MAG: four-carbon acid sugar kinase family protein [Candidatus Solibacter sp.]
METLLVADDLTGACDAAVHFAMRGLRPAVVRLPGHAYTGHARVVACSTESRDMAPAAIRGALVDVAAEFRAVAVGRVFKKIDSTLRGNVGMEVAAARDAFNCDAAVVCPAFPAMRRVVEQGILRAPQLAPINMRERLCEQSGEACVHVCPRDLADALASGARLISVDAIDNADLRQIAEVLCGVDGRRILWAGSAGLASALASHIDGVETPPILEAARGPVLFCIGSDHAVTLEQQAALLASRACTLSETGALAAGRHVVMRIPRGSIPAARFGAARPAALVVSGGDTASLVFHAIGACAIELYAEIVAGVPYGLLRGGMFDGLPVVTKSGGFGDRDTLVNVADFFHAPI